MSSSVCCRRCLRALRQEAPKVVFVVQNVDYWRIPDLLASGDITVGISQTRGLPANAKRKLLRHIQPSMLRADASDTPLTLDEYCSRPHVLVSHIANVSGFADEWLAEIGRTRQVVLSVPQYSSLPALLAGTDLIASLPDYTAAGHGSVRAVVHGTVSVQDADAGSVHGLAQSCRQRPRRTLVALAAGVVHGRAQFVVATAVSRTALCYMYDLSADLQE